MHTRVNRSLCANRSISCITQLLMLATKLKMTHLCNVSISAISPYGRSLLAGSLLWQEFQTLMTSTFMAHHCLVCCLATRPPSLTRNSFFLNVYLKPLLGLCFICENFQKFFFSCSLIFFSLFRYRKEMRMTFSSFVLHLSTSVPCSLAKQRNPQIAEHVRTAKSTVLTSFFLWYRSLYHTVHFARIKDMHDWTRSQPRIFSPPNTEEKVPRERAQAM